LTYRQLTVKIFFDNIPFILRGYIIFGGLKIGCSKSTESLMYVRNVDEIITKVDGIAGYFDIFVI